MKKIFLLCLCALLVLTGCSSSSPSFSGNITPLNGVAYDFGKIDIMGGVVSRTFAFKNESTTDLTIFTSTSSCGCTEGQIILADGSKTSQFSASKPLETPVVVPAGEQFSAQIWYDPLFHGPNDLGKRYRSLILLTSAPSDGSILQPNGDDKTVFEISVTGEVISTTDS